MLKSLFVVMILKTIWTTVKVSMAFIPQPSSLLIKQVTGSSPACWQQTNSGATVTATTAETDTAAVLHV